MTYTREDDPVIALQQAAIVMADGRFQEIARVNGDLEAARTLTNVADVFVAWLRQPKNVMLTLLAVEEMDDGSPSTTEGTP